MAMGWSQTLFQVKIKIREFQRIKIVKLRLSSAWPIWLFRAFFSFWSYFCSHSSELIEQKFPKKYLGIKFESNRRPWISLTKSNLGRDLQKAFPVNLPVITQRVTMAKSVLPFRELNKYFSTDFRKFFEFQDFSDAWDIGFFSTRDGCEFKYVWPVKFC